MKTFSTNLVALPGPLLVACERYGLSAVQSNPLAADLVLWEASDRTPGLLSTSQAASIQASLKKGGRLLLTLDRVAGLSPLLLHEVLPTTGWATQAHLTPYTPQDPLRVGEVDDQFFKTGLAEVSVPYCLDIRPASAVERGQSQYERYDLVHPLLQVPIAAHSDFWTRSLLNREWTVRARCNNLAGSALVVTGRYGAGKVVLVGTSVAGLSETASAGTFWSSILQWLGEDEPRDSAPGAKPAMAATIADGQVHVQLSNPGASPLAIQIVLRVLAESGSVLADGQGEQQRRLSLAAKTSSAVTLRLPAPGRLADASLEDDGSLQVRVGLLSGDGSTLLAEQRMTAFEPALRLEIRTDNLYSRAYPFHAPGPDALGNFASRMGSFVGAYAFAPGETIQGHVLLSHGLRNLAPAAVVQDVLTPGNQSAMALNDRAAGFRKSPTDKITAYSMWTGQKSVENVLQFTLEDIALISAVTIVGAYGRYGNAAIHCPGAAQVEIDGRVVAASDGLDTAFTAGFGQARLPFESCRGKIVTLRLPWIDKFQNAHRQEPWLYEVRIEGWTAELPAPRSNQLLIHLVDAHTGQKTEVLSQPLTAAGCSLNDMAFRAPLPKLGGIRFYRLEASFGPASGSVPALTLEPSRPLLPMTDLRPPNSAGLGLNVTRGFREFNYPGTGTGEPWGVSWASPDDLVWAYSRMLKETPLRSSGLALRLYVNETDMRHYSIPWRSFPNGELFLVNGASRIVAQLRKDTRWSGSETVQLTFGDRWVAGPALSNLNGWQDYVEFDKYLRSTGAPGLSGRTHAAVGEEINGVYQTEWQVWQLDRYVRSVGALREAFEAEGKTLVISAQGLPMVAGEAGRKLSLTLRGMQDDSTWSMLDESPVLTTGRQMSELAFNPVWAMSNLLAYGFNSALFNNWQWHSPVGTIEPTRRHNYDRAWRATLWDGGRYGSVYTYGFAANAGVAYTMSEQDYQQWWYLQEREGLIAPEAPLGAGLVISTAKYLDPKHLRWDCGDALNMPEALLLTLAFRSLHDAGVSLPFAANASSLHEYSLGAPLILLNVGDFSSTEVAELKQLHARGILLAAFATRASLPPDAAALFSLPGTLLLEHAADTLSRADALRAADQLRTALRLPIRFPAGTAGYGFRSQDTSLIVVEDWFEQAREAEVQVLKSPGARIAWACNVNDHQPLTIVDDGANWRIQIPIRSGDGVLIALKEADHGS